MTKKKSRLDMTPRCSRRRRSVGRKQIQLEVRHGKAERGYEPPGVQKGLFEEEEVS